MEDNGNELTRESLLAAAAAEDAKSNEVVDKTPDERPVDDPEPGTPEHAAKEAKTEKTKPESSSSKADKAKEPKETDKPNTKAASKEPAEGDDKGERPKSKWQQNEERKNKTWAEINAEKEAIKAQRDAVEKQKRELQRQAEEVQRAKVTAEPFRDEHGVTAKEYRDVAARLRKDGDATGADAAEQLAKNLETKHQKLLQERNVAELRAKWQQTYDELSDTDEYSALKDENSDLYKETMEVLKQFAFLAYQADGLKQAAALAAIRVNGKSFDGTKAELAKLKDEHSKLQKKLSIGGGSPTNQPEEDAPFEKLSEKDMRRRLEQAAHSYDREHALV